MPAPTTIRAAVIADSPGLVSAVDLLFKVDDDIELVDCPLSLRAALESCWNVVDVALVDMDSDEVCGLEVISHLKQAHPRLHLIALGGEDPSHRLCRVLETGAAGYLCKSDIDRLLTLSVRLVTQGGVPLSPMVAEKWARTKPVPIPPHPMAALLSQRESEVLATLAQGMAYKQVAHLLGLSSHTVHAHVRNIYAKLGVSTRSEAIHLARELGIAQS